MGLLDKYKIKRAISVIHTSYGTNHAATSQAIAQIKELGSTAVPILIAALDQAQVPEPLMELLTSFLRDDTLPLYVKQFGSNNHRIVARITDILTTCRSYNPNKLIEFFATPHYPKRAFCQILVAHKDRLDERALLGLLDSMDKESRSAILQLIDEVATESMIPALLPYATSEEWITRHSIARTLARFHSPQVQSLLLALLEDPHKTLRQIAIEGLALTKSSETIGPLCKMLRDPDLTVHNKAVEAIIQINAPETVPHLLELLQDESEYVRRGAVEILNEVGSPSAIKELLGALRDKDWWVRVRAADALGTIGGPAVIEAVLELIKDEDEFIRRSAVEILNSTKDERTFDCLIGALQDSDWWVRERAVDALAHLGDPRAVQALCPMLGDNDDTNRVVIRALGTLGEPKALDYLLGVVPTAPPSLMKDLLNTITTLTTSEYAQNVFAVLQEVTQSGTTSSVRLAQQALQTLESTLGTTNASLPHAGPNIPVLQTQSQTVVHTGALESLLAPQEDLPGATKNIVLPSQESRSEVTSILDVEALVPGALLADRYRIIKHVGKGAFGIVLNVEDTMVKEEIILKFLNPSLSVTDVLIKRFIHELRYSRRITHENVIRIFDFLTFGKSYAISMEYFRSQPLSALIKTQGQVSQPLALKIISDICAGMSAAHQVQVIHRDLKPANILINDQHVLKVVDFGLAAAVSEADSRVTKTGYMVGTPSYMSPEQIRGDAIDARTDIYSLGIIMYELLTGKPPYTGKDPVSIIYQHMEGKLTPPRLINTSISPALEAIVLQALAVHPAQRFQSMDELRKAIAELKGV
jgi:serine/threonine-protein kinase